MPISEDLASLSSVLESAESVRNGNDDGVEIWIRPITDDEHDAMCRLPINIQQIADDLSASLADFLDGGFDENGKPLDGHPLASAVASAIQRLQTT